ncbi:MAG: serine/threonine-protein kinase, partial [Pseudomonadota bacterium]
MSASHLPIGQVIKDFEITQVLGQGGFGVTYLGIDLSRKSLVAIKEHFPSSLAVRDPHGGVQAKSPDLEMIFQKTRDDFYSEAHLLSRFPHDALPRFRRLIEGQGTAYLVMDFEKGETLRKWANAQSPQNLEQDLLHVLDAICDALQLLHRNGVYHRDIKPDNIIVRTDGSPVLIDFGIAHDALRAQRRATALPDLVLATEGFSPIEQYSSDAGGPWSDVYSISATCYDVLAHNRLIDARRRAQAQERREPDPLPPIANASAVPISPQFASAISAGMAISPRQRPQSIAAWSAMLPAAQ